MPKIIEIKEFTEIITNADPQDIPQNALTRMENALPQPGKVVKTHGFGDNFYRDKVDVIANPGIVWDDRQAWNDGKYWIDSALATALDRNFDNVVVFVHREFDNIPNGSGPGYAVIAYTVDETTGIVSLFYWDGDSWADIAGLLKNTFITFYHKKAANPIIQHNDILRFLPGNISDVGGNEAKTIWIGYLDRDLFDENITAGTAAEVTAGTKTYEKGFYNFRAEILKPDLIADNWTVAPGLDPEVLFLSGGTFNPDNAGCVRFYKFSFVYDGVQESELSDVIKADFTEDSFLNINLTFRKSAVNKRITALKVYRSLYSESGYKLVHTCDLTRKADKVLADDDALSGRWNIYYPALADINFDPVNSNYWIGVRNPADGAPSNPEDYTWKQIIAPTGTGHTVFTIDGGEDAWGGDYWDYRCSLKNQPVGGGDYGYLHSASFGVYCGTKTIILPDQDLSVENYAGAVIWVDHASAEQYYFQVLGNKEKAIHLGDDDIEENGPLDWKMCSVANGLFFVDAETIGGTVPVLHLRLFDTGLADGADAPLKNKINIKVNTEFALMFKDRLFTLNNVLDPADKKEVRPGWGGYSEMNQPDVLPDSNALTLPDREGGPGTGLAIVFGAVIFMKKHALFRLLVNDPADTSTWDMKEAKFNRGNVAKHGYVQVGETLYICSEDGIYQIDLSTITASDETPLLNNRISEPINDVYLALNSLEKENIKAGYDQIRSEIVYQFTPTSIKWAFNILTRKWRQINTSVNFDVHCIDQDANLVIADNTTRQLFSPVVAESTPFVIKSKTFHVSDERKEIVRYVKLRYKSALPISLNLYVNDDNDTPVKTYTLEASSTPVWVGRAIRYRCNNFRVEIASTVNNTAEIEIYDVNIEHD